MPPRKSFSVQEKIRIIGLKEQSAMSNRKFAESVGVNESMIRRWVRDKEMFACQSRLARRMRKLPRKRIGRYPYLEQAVKKWIEDRNSRGLCVKDHFIQAKARQVREELLTTMPSGDEKDLLEGFKASNMWIHRFKSRHRLVARRHTTTHTLPDDFQEQAIGFIKSVHKQCEDFEITRDCIINMDQVPRYFEMNMSRTITTKGTREVLLRKSSTSHKRFTFTPFVSAAGKFIQKHALFSNLKKIPKHHAQSSVSVNKTGMFNAEILKSTIDDTLKQIRGLFSNKSVLMIIDSYGVHLKFIREHGAAYNDDNVYFAVVPPRLTGLLQPLDVALNRSFQQFFNNKSIEYQEESIMKVIADHFICFYFICFSNFSNFSNFFHFILGY